MGSLGFQVCIGFGVWTAPTPTSEPMQPSTCSLPDNHTTQRRAMPIHKQDFWGIHVSTGKSDAQAWRAVETMVSVFGVPVF